MPRLFVRGASELPEKEVEQLFEKYGRVVNIQTGQAGFSFIEMETDKDCDSAISGLDGIEIEGHKLTVEKAKGKEHGHGGGRGSKESKSGEFLCYNCNKPGHLARDCKEKPRNPLYVDTRGTKITDVSRHSQDRYHPYARSSNDRSKYDDGQSRERRFERSPPREARDPREYREIRDPREREIREHRYSTYDRPAERRYPSPPPPPSDRRPPPEYYRGAVPMRDYPPVQRGRSPERAPVRYGGTIPERRIPDPRIDNFARPARGSDYYMDRRLPVQTDSYRRSPEPAYIPRPRSRSPPEHYRDSTHYRAAVPPSDVYPRGRSPDRLPRPVPQRGPEIRRGRSPERYPETVETRRYSRSPPPVQAEYRYQGSTDRFRNERRDDNDYGRGRRERRTPERARNDVPDSFGSGMKRPLTPESKPDDGRPQTP